MKTKLSLLLFTILFALMPIKSWAAEAYAVLNNGTLTFYYDSNKSSRTGTKYTVGSYDYEWYKNTSITKVVFNSSFASYYPTSTSFWFEGLENLKTITGLNYLKTDQVTKMNWMFHDCYSLTSLDLSSFNTSNVTSMVGMFANCSSLTSLNLSSFNTSRVTDMSNMFSRCSNLTSLNLSSFNTSNVTTMFDMFYGCSSLTSLNLSSFNMSKVTATSWMFYGCTSLKTIYANSNWNTSTNTNSSYMFSDCTSLVGGKGTKYNSSYTDKTYARPDGGTSSPGYFTGDGSSDESDFVYNGGTIPYCVLNNSTLTFYYDDKPNSRTGKKYNIAANYTAATQRAWHNDTINIKKGAFDASFASYRPTSTSRWFYGCSNMAEISGMENLNTTNVTNMGLMFYKCKSLTSLDVSNFETSRVTDMEYMFYGCSNLTRIGGIENLITDNVTNMGVMFYDCSSLTSLDVSNFETSKVTDMQFMFSSCSALTHIDVSKFNTTNVKDMNSMFQSCSSLTKLDVSDFDTHNVTNMDHMFFKCHKLTSLDVSSFDTSNVTDMGAMFYECKLLGSLDVSGFITNKVTQMDFMFQSCEKLTSLNLKNFVVTNVTTTRCMFNRCSALKTIYANTSWNISTNTNSDYMFSDCTSLVGGNGTKYNSSNVNKTYARPDASGTPGYFTKKADGDLTTTSSTIAYAVFSGSTLTFYYDNQSKNRSGAKYAIKNTYTISGSKPGWYEIRMKITRVVFDESFTDYRPSSTACWFYNFNKVESIDGMKYLNTSSVTNMEGMFRFCYVLKHIDLSNFDTRNVTNMSCLFCNCKSFANIDVSTFNTEKVTDMSHMFHLCPVTELDLSMFDTKNVSKTNLMFCNCSTLKTIYGSRALWSNKKMTQSQSEYMFTGCNVLVGGMGTKFTTAHTRCEYAIIDDGPTVNPGYLTDPLPAEKEAYAVYKDNVLTFYYDNLIRTRTGNIYRYNAGEFRTKSDDGWAKHFNDALVKTVVFDPSFGDFHELTTTKYWFGHKDKSILTEFRGMQYLNTENVTDMSNMFLGCRALTSVDVSHFDTGNVMTMLGMFCYCTKIKSLDLTSFDTAKCLDMSFMFGECSSMTSVDVSSFDTGRVTTMEKMFYYCSSLPKLDITMFDTHSCKNMVGMFKSCYNLTTLDVSSFDTHNVEKMDDGTYGGMFEYCNKVTTIYVGDGWSTAGLTSHSDMLFKECTSLVGGLGTRYDPAHTDYTYAHVDGGRSNPGYLTYKDSSCDVNDDGKVDVADIATVIDVMAGKSDAATEKAADVNNDGKVDVADIATIIDVMAGGEVSGGGNETVPDNAPKDVVAVDLGLPSGTKWANMNVGATKVEDYGQFFAWGETTGYSSVNTSDGRSFNWNSYKWCSSTDTKMTKYCTNSAYGTVDNITVLDTADDAARANWGGQWVMPTKEEIQELFDGTISEWTTQNGVNGRRFTSKTNGNSIFLPAAGMRYNAILNGQGASGCYWSASLMLSGSYHAHYLDFNSGAISISNVYRSFGYSVRPVIRK